MKNQRIRNLTTHILHTKIEHVYEDVEYITGEKGVMTHMLPNVVLAMTKWLKAKLNDKRFWNKKLDTNHTGETNLQPMNKEELKDFWARYMKLPHPSSRRWWTILLNTVI
jgi:hypothetical protein